MKPRYISFLVIIMGIALSTMSPVAISNDRADFNGEFSSVISSSPDCEGIFAETDYHGLFQLTGPTRRTLVSSFKNKSKTGFFHNQIFVSLFGYNNDFLYEKTIENNTGRYEVRAEGFVNYSVVYIEFDVKRVDIECSAQAIYSGFN